MSQDQEVLKQACYWYAQLRQESVCSDTLAEWSKWLNASAKNKAVWHKLERFNLNLKQLDGRTLQSSINRADKVIFKRRALLSAVALIGSGVVLGSQLYPVLTYSQNLENWSRVRLADHQTPKGQRQLLEVSDTTKVWLNTRTALNMKSSQHFELVRGEVFLKKLSKETVKFSIDFAEIETLGGASELGLCLEQDFASLAVFSGQVMLRLLSGDERRLGEGFQLELRSERFGTLHRAEAYKQSWVDGVLIVDNWPVERVVAELRRYHDHKVTIDEDLKVKRLIGRYSLDDMDRTLHTIARSLNAVFEKPHFRPWRITT